MCYSCYTQKWVAFPISSLKQNLHTWEALQFFFLSPFDETLETSDQPCLLQIFFFFECCHGSYLGAVSPATSSFCRGEGGHYSFLFPPCDKEPQGTTELHHPGLLWPDLSGSFSYWKAKVLWLLVCLCTYPGLCVGNGMGRADPAQHSAVRGSPCRR